MTTLVAVRAELHQLAERQATLRLRVRRGELVERRRVTNAVMLLGHRHRDLMLNAPIRWAGQIASERGLNPRLLLRALERIMRDELTAIAAASLAKAGEAGEDG